MHARPQRPAARSASPHRRGASDAPGVGPTPDPSAMARAQLDHRTALWPDQTTRGLPALDGVGTRRRQNPMVPPLYHVKSARPLLPLARAPPARNGELEGTGPAAGKRIQMGGIIMGTDPSRVAKRMGCQRRSKLAATPWP